MATSSCQASSNRPKWSIAEENVLIRAVFDREETLFGAMAGCGAVKLGEKRRLGWQEVAEILNSQFFSNLRDAKECRKKFHNLKQKAKQIHDALKNPATGGGKMKTPTASESLMLEFIGNRASVAGVEGGVETDAVLAVSPEFSLVEEQQLCTETSNNCTPANTENSSEAPVSANNKENNCSALRKSSLNCETTPAKGRKAVKRQYQDLAETTLILDQKKMAMEMQLLQSKLEESQRNINLINTKERKLGLEIDCLIEKKSILSVKKELLNLKLKSAVDFSLL